MKNVNMTIEGTTLTITVNLDAPGDVSKSGKSLIIASSEGNRPVPGTENIKIGLNIYRPVNQ